MKNFKKIMKGIVKNKVSGITLISLVVTIIVLLILAGISISMLSGENGILNKTTEAREQTIIGQEKEEIGLAYSSLVGDNVVKGTEITDRLFEDEINKNRGGTEVSVDSDLDDYIVYYESTNHTYLVKKNGTIELIENIEPTETIYVTLYSDGTLAFSNNNATDSTKTVTKTYAIAKDDLYDYSADTVPWKNERVQIIYVDFVNKIVPTNTQSWFLKCENLQKIKHMENLNTSKTDKMCKMFSGCSKLEEIDLSNFSTKNSTDLYALFQNCSSIKSLVVSRFKTNRATTMKGMFTGCTRLISLDLRNFDTSNVTDMCYMFGDCTNLTSLNLSVFNTSNVTDMEFMFENCSSLTNLDLSNFKTNKVTNMAYMFKGCTRLTTIYATDIFVTTAITTNENDNGIFNHCTSLVGGNGTTYNSSKVDKEYARIDKAGQPGYFTYKSNN